jgi:hypothetical protein
LLRRTFLIRKGVQDMRNFCPFCKNPLTPWYQWEGADGRLYCNEFCADAGETTIELTTPPPELRERPARGA